MIITYTWTGHHLYFSRSSPILKQVIGSIGVQLGPHQQPTQEALNNRNNLDNLDNFDNQPDDMLGVHLTHMVKHHPAPLLHQCSHLGFFIIFEFVLNQPTLSLSLTSPIRKTTGWPSGRTKRSSFMPHRGSLYQHRIPMKQWSLSPSLRIHLLLQYFSICIRLYRNTFRIYFHYLWGLCRRICYAQIKSQIMHPGDFFWCVLTSYGKKVFHG